jgi:Restriction endonuclease
MPFPYKKIAKRLAQGDSAKTTKGKGSALEDIVSWTFCSLPGVRVLKRNFVDAAGASEIDLLLYNDARLTPAAFLSEFPIIECKNWSEPVDSKTVRDFIGKVRAAHLTVGILVAANGVTGNANDRKAANDQIRLAFDADAIKIIVIARSDIQGLRSREGFLEFLQDRYGDVILRSFCIA